MSAPNKSGNDGGSHSAKDEQPAQPVQHLPATSDAVAEQVSPLLDL